MAHRTRPYRPLRPTVPELSAGAVLVDPSRLRVLLLHEIAEGRWTLPKGHVDPGETLAQAARREVAEETGIRPLALAQEIAEVRYRFFDPQKRRNVHKTVVYFLARTRPVRLKLEPIFDRAEWVTIPSALKRVRYRSDRDVLSAARRAVRRRPTARARR